MPKTYSPPGNVLSHIAASAVANGEVLLLGARVGVALNAIASGATGPVQVCGVFAVAKVTNDDIAQGAAVYWDNTAKRMTVVLTGNTLAGYAFKAAGVGVATVEVNLNA